MAAIRGLKNAWSAGKRFLDFNTEQQADFCSHYYSALTSGGDTSAIRSPHRRGQASQIPRRQKKLEMDDGVIPARQNAVA